MAERVRARVLIVDDEVAVLETMRRNLWPFFDVTAASGSKEALELIATQEPFEVVVVDLKMPGMDGITLLSCIRKISPDTVRVLLTGHGDIKVVIAAVNEGNVFRFLTKPCPHWALTCALEDSVRQYRQATAGCAAGS